LPGFQDKIVFSQIYCPIFEILRDSQTNNLIRLGQKQILGQMDANADRAEVFLIEAGFDNDLAFINVFLDGLMRQKHGNESQVKQAAGSGFHRLLHLFAFDHLAPKHRPSRPSAAEADYDSY
jgi:hypothetical protein